jgi:putative two-component system response regulator
VYDALTSRRSYKEAMSHEAAVKIIVSERETHFDPDIVDVFEQSLDIFRRIQMLESFKEHPESIDDILNVGHG